MTEQEITALGPAFAAYLRRFRRCFGQDRTAGHFDTSCRGLLSDLPEEWGLPTPPVFARCTAVLDPEDEMAAVTLYWQAVTRGLPMAGLGPTHRALTACIRHNPHVAEPRLMLAPTRQGWRRS